MSLINKEKLKDCFEDDFGAFTPIDVCNVIDAQPIVECATGNRKYSRWNVHLDRQIATCQTCMYTTEDFRTTPYCPYCGSRMLNYIWEEEEDAFDRR